MRMRRGDQVYPKTYKIKPNSAQLVHPFLFPLSVTPPCQEQKQDWSKQKQNTAGAILGPVAHMPVTFHSCVCSGVVCIGGCKVCMCVRYVSVCLCAMSSRKDHNESESDT